MVLTRLEVFSFSGLKLLADLVINHSSDEHPWFSKSIARIEPYTDYYVWADAKGFDHQGRPIPPNNWVWIPTNHCEYLATYRSYVFAYFLQLSVFGGSAWEWNDRREQFYLHQFAVKQPDFNLRNPELREEIKVSASSPSRKLRNFNRFGL